MFREFGVAGTQRGHTDGQSMECGQASRIENGRLFSHRQRTTDGTDVPTDEKGRLPEIWASGGNLSDPNGYRRVQRESSCSIMPWRSS